MTAIRSRRFRGFPGSSTTAMDLLRRLSGPPCAQQHHYPQRAEDREKNSQELVPFGDLSEKYFEGHLASSTSRPPQANDCEVFCKRYASTGLWERQVRGGGVGGVPKMHKASLRPETPDGRNVGALGPPPPSPLPLRGRG